MSPLRLAFAAALAAGLVSPVWAQTANSSSGAGSATQSSSGGTTPQGGNASPGTANGQNAATSSGGTAAQSAGSSKMGAPTAVEQQEQQKSDRDTKICTNC